MAFWGLFEYCLELVGGSWITHGVDTVEYNVPFLSFVFSYVVNASHLRRKLINLFFCNIRYWEKLQFS